ncbi:MAG: enoyl-CoA hydratase-related protein [Actinomycetota bacterium]|nr:enoyl-CoA hydratase-related protein [Actinomycetota bacterium]
MLEYSVEDGVGRIVLNRPQVLNAFNDELGSLLRDRVAEAAADSDVRCIVLTGAGRAFSAGEDVAALAERYEAGRPPDLGQLLTQRYNPLIKELRAAPKPIVAGLNGVAAGAGASVALACDFRVASERASLSFAFARVGLVPDSGATWFLARMLGPARALELALSSPALSSADALELGLVNEVVPADEFRGRLEAVAAGLAHGPTTALALTKGLIEAAVSHTLDEQLEAEARAQEVAGGTQDHLEGVRAFLSKRNPEFEGR